ncbi:lysophospholipid acyltransferase family protein [Mycobacterium sp. CVI_P3]|uniref:Lysophospholipid acyltransferase family protein n=1 Tax=Mycobacterium pinniadriaticum TaxID=2994102 RepID=A0ABT3SMJ5_9MYCO|nr:lysophospholipid acyltransferase family protein [Mycobacterium pinniadriaticum]MCX2934150.1 lysophospholipid acyltransferase family protein [Mycobacterium pinniadriaticum]MCX2940572.1 lysophospholipid acyltransferase family protein [Mycobacterium pinniadriaticum]
MVDNVVAEQVPDELAKWDPEFTRRITQAAWPLVRRYFRAEVRGLDRFPRSGAALLVGNHSGGMLTPDVPVFGPAFYAEFGYDRPLYTLAHYGIFIAPWGPLLPRLGVVHASPEAAAAGLRAGAVVLVFPGGDYDAFRPTHRQNVIDFEGRTGYARTAIEAGVPIVPMVSIGAQETQFFLARGTELAYRLGLHRIRMDILPVSVGLPFGLTATFPPNFPLPSKIVMEVLEPVDPAAFGTTPDVDEVDDHVRRVMQRALDRLARQRRFPVLG